MFNLTFSSFNAKETSKTFGGFSLKEIEIENVWKWKFLHTSFCLFGTHTTRVDVKIEWKLSGKWIEVNVVT
jgi:hypothetical protein